MKTFSRVLAIRFPGSLPDFLSRLTPQSGTRPRHYLIAVSLMCLALLARLYIVPIDGGVQYVTFFPAVAISAVIGGLWPGLIAAMTGLALATWLFWPPYGQLVFDFNRHMVVSNMVFVVDAMLVCSAIQGMHRYYNRYVRLERKLRLSASVFENSAEGLMVTDAEGTIVSVNPAFSDITGYPPEEVLGRNSRLLRSSRHAEPFYRLMWKAIVQDGFWEGEIWNRRKNGENYLQWTTINRIDDARRVAENYVAVFHDVTDSRKKDYYIKHLAYHDALTGLPNRTLFNDRLAHAIELARRQGRRLVVAFIDLDRFKQVNDEFGHEVGDQLLKRVTRRIRRHLRKSDTAARIGGDEFVVLMENMRGLGNFDRMVTAIISDISRPVDLGDQQVQVGASIGIARFPQDGETVRELLQHADRAMYDAKEGGRNTYRFFSDASGMGG